MGVILPILLEHRSEFLGWLLRILLPLGGAIGTLAYLLLHAVGMLVVTLFYRDARTGRFAAAAARGVWAVVTLWIVAIGGRSAMLWGLFGGRIQTDADIRVLALLVGATNVLIQLIGWGCVLTWFVRRQKLVGWNVFRVSLVLTVLLFPLDMIVAMGASIVAMGIPLLFAS